MDHPTFLDPKSLEQHFDFIYTDTLRFSSDNTKKHFLKHYTKARKIAEEFPLWQGAFYRREIEEAKWPPICIQWIDEVVGYGVFATEDLPAKMYIGEYTGEVAERTLRFRFNLYCMAFLREASGFRKFLINGKSCGNFTRFFNHSTQPNLLLQTVYSEYLPHMIFTTTRPIKKKEQLTFDYGESYWRQCQKIPKIL